MQPAPASILRIKSLCPGTSTKLMRRGLWSARHCIERSESQIDGDATPLLFRQAIGVNAGKCTDERGLAVIDVTRCSDDDGFDRLGHAERSFVDGDASRSLMV